MEIQEIKEILLKLKFNINSKGFDYWVQAIHLYTTFNEPIKMSELYTSLSFDFMSRNESCIERAMRTASKQAYNEIHKYFNYNGKITNSVILKLFRFYNDMKER